MLDVIDKYYVLQQVYIQMVNFNFQQSAQSFLPKLERIQIEIVKAGLELVELKQSPDILSSSVSLKYGVKLEGEIIQPPVNIKIQADRVLEAHQPLK